MTSDSSQNFLYSHKATAELAATVRRINGKHDRFATDFMALPRADEQAAIATRIEAWKNPATNLWQLEKHTVVPFPAFGQTDGSPGAATIKIEVVAKPGLCFFDALHYCSAFEATEKEKGKHPLAGSGEEWSKTTLWRKAAEAAGQAVDADGIVHPCAYGRILSEGFFGRDAMVTAQRSASLDFSTPVSTKLPALADMVVGEFLAKSASVPALPDNDLVARHQKKQDLINTYQAAISAGDHLCRVVKKIYESEFKLQYETIDDDGDPYIASSYTGFYAILTLGMLPAYRYLKGNPAYGPERAFSLATKKFNACVEALPESPEKQLCRDFNKIAAFGFWMQRAVVLRNENVQKGKTAKDGLPCIEKAAATTGLSPVDLSRLKNEYMAGRLLGGEFDQLAEVAWRGSAYSRTGGKVRHALTKRMEQISAHPA